MFLILAAVFKISEPENQIEYKLSWPKTYKTSLLVLTSVIGLFALTFVLRFTLADIFQKRAENFSGENLGKSLTSYQNAQKASPVKNPYLLADFSYNLATWADQLQDSENLEKKSDSLAQEAFALSPQNFLVLDKITKAYIALSSNSQEYYDQVQKLGQKLTEVAPTYPPAYLTKAKAEIVAGQENEARAALQKALELKADYLEEQELMQQLK